MHIALVVPWLEVGGMETFIFSLAAELQAQEHRVQIVATEREGAWFASAAKRDVSAVCLRADRTWSEVAHARKVGRFLSESGFEVCLLNHSRQAQAAIGMLPDRVAVIPVIHNDCDAIYAVGCANAQAWNVAVAVSPKVFAETCRRAAGKPVREIHYGVALPKPDVSAARDASSPELRIVYAGRLEHSQKGVLFLPRILAECVGRGVPLDLSLVGDGPDRQSLLAEAANLGVSHLMKFKGVLPRDTVYSELARAHVLIMPSFYEGLSLALLEALACGCVPVVAKLPGITSFLSGPAQAGMEVEAGVVDGFADALQFLASDRERLATFSAQARRLAEERFTCQRMCRQYLELFSLARDGAFPLPRPRSELPSLDRSFFGIRDSFPRRADRVFTLLRRLIRR
ncbi:MAG: glycosyltransferase family 4 protein [Verrucomicrobiia bacterium]